MRPRARIPTRGHENFLRPAIRPNFQLKLGIMTRIANRTASLLHRTRQTAAALVAMLLAFVFALDATPLAQSAGWQAEVEVKKSAAPRLRPGVPNTTVIERNGTKIDQTGPASGSQLKLVALLTEGQPIDQGLIWRIYINGADANAKSKLIAENREPSPSLKLQPGDYTINASFGRANLTRKVTVKPGLAATEQFVLNAGGLRLTASVDGKPAASNATTYAIFSDDRDQFANRSAVMTGARTGLIIRLNAGIYHVVSTYGDGNARVETDVTVEAGKLTEASVVHTAAKATFKLVMRAGGEALPDTHWSIQSGDTEVIKGSVGALPTHVLAPGEYVVVAKAAGRVFKRSFSLKNGESANVEVLMEGGEATQDSEQISPSLEIKNP